MKKAKQANNATQAAHSYIDWMRVSIVPFTSALVIMPATLVVVLPIGALLVMCDLLSAQHLVTSPARNACGIDAARWFVSKAD